MEATQSRLNIKLKMHHSSKRIHHFQNNRTEIVLCTSYPFGPWLWKNAHFSADMSEYHYHQISSSFREQTIVLSLQKFLSMLDAKIFCVGGGKKLIHLWVLFKIGFLHFHTSIIQGDAILRIRVNKCDNLRGKHFDRASQRVFK